MGLGWHEEALNMLESLAVITALRPAAPQQIVGGDFLTAWPDNQASGEIENQDSVVVEPGLVGFSFSSQTIQ